jgi:hypothetical protein
VFLCGELLKQEVSGSHDEGTQSRGETHACRNTFNLIFSCISIDPLTTKDKAICCQNESCYDTGTAIFSSESEMTRMHITYNNKEEKIRTLA